MGNVPLFGEFNVGFSQTFANLLLPTLPADHGIVLLNTGVGGTGFIDGNWVVPNGPLTVFLRLEILAVRRLESALSAINTSRPCTGTANSRIFSDLMADGKTPNGEPDHRSGVTGDVIHFNATQAVLMGHEYWAAYNRALALERVVPSARTAACSPTNPTFPVTNCTAAR